MSGSTVSEICIPKIQHAVQFSGVLGGLPVKTVADRQFINTYTQQFNFVKALNKGCNGEVWTATSKDANYSNIVVKVFDISRLNLETLKMIEFESQNLAKRGYKSEILLDEKESKLYLTMPKFGRIDAGKQLKKLEKALISTDPERALASLIHAFKILEAILIEIADFHQATGLVHGDAWMENFMISNNNGSYKAKVIDYGACCQSGITYMQYLAKHKVGVGSYHTAPEIPCKSIPDEFKCKASKITSSADLHAIFADFIFRSVFNVYDHFADEKGGVVNSPIYKQINKFMEFSLQYCCNSKAFAVNISSNDLPKAITEKCKHTPESRCTIEEAIDYVQNLVLELEKDLEKDTEGVHTKHGR